MLPSQPFSQQINKDEVANPYDTIKEPMDLSTMELDPISNWEPEGKHGSKSPSSTGPTEQFFGTEEALNASARH